MESPSPGAFLQHWRKTLRCARQNVSSQILQIPFTTDRSRGTSENACNSEVRTSVIVKVMNTADELGVVTRRSEGNTEFPVGNTQNKQVSFPPPPATFMDSLKFAHGPQTRTTKWVPSSLSKGKKQNREKCQQGSGVPSPSEPRPCCPPLCDAGQAAGLSVPQFARFPGRSCWRPCPRGRSGAAGPDSPRRQPALAVRVLGGAVQNLPSCSHCPPVFGSPVSGGRWDSR